MNEEAISTTSAYRLLRQDKVLWCAHEIGLFHGVHRKNMIQTADSSEQ